jgi:hypothetical protein
MRWATNFEEEGLVITDVFGNVKTGEFKLAAGHVTYSARLYMCEYPGLLIKGVPHRLFSLKTIDFETEFDGWLSAYFDDNDNYSSRPEVPEDKKIFKPAKGPKG